MDADHRGEAAIAGRDLHERQGIGDIIGLGATKSLRRRHAHQAELCQFGEQFDRIPAVRFPLNGVGCDAITGKGGNRVPDGLLRLRQPHATIPARRALMMASASPTIRSIRAAQLGTS